MTILNLGCGHRFNFDWINIDFISTDEGVLSYNLLNGIPFNDNQVDVVYHSHLLEHFSKSQGISFIKECFRVLKPGGIIRIAVPDLEGIVKQYLKNLEGALDGDSNLANNYEWIMLEMYDQTVRNSSGGKMAKYLYQKEVPNKKYVFNRIGEEGKALMENYLNTISKKSDKQKRSLLVSIKILIKKVYKFSKSVLIHALFKNELEALKIGKFRLSGEVHQWMYDRYSLRKLLNDCGFKEIRIVTAFESDIKDWDKYQLDSIEGIVRKPDSLFIEALK